MTATDRTRFQERSATLWDTGAPLTRRDLPDFLHSVTSLMNRSITSCLDDWATARTGSQHDGRIGVRTDDLAESCVIEDYLSELKSDVTSAVTGGKLMRPQFCYWGFVAVAGRTAGRVVVRAAAAMELLHGFALVHDDVMDGSDTRRNRLSTHAAWALRHARGGWRGEPRRFAEGMAILVGDLAFNLAHRLASNLPSAAAQEWHRMCRDLIVGQYLDMAGTAAGHHDISLARVVAALKSARYTLLGPLRLGASLARGHISVANGVGANGTSHPQGVAGTSTAGLTEALEEYGSAIGEAFQLRDDLLGVFGTAAETGKPVGDDLREGKPTMLIALAHQRADLAGRALLGEVGRPDLAADTVARIRELLETTGARDSVERLIGEAVERGKGALRGTVTHPAALQALSDLADQAAWRQR